MRQVVFEEVGVENFCCFIEPIVIKLSGNRLIMVTGPNGSGKTSAINDSILWILYGITTKGAKGSDVVNDIIGKNCFGYLKFKIDNTQYRVERYYGHKKHGNNVLLIKDDIVIKNGHKEVLPEIERILTSQKLFVNTRLFAQKVKDFFTDLTDSQQKEIFRKVLLLEMYVLYQKEATVRENKIESDIEKAAKDISVNLGILSDIKEQIEYQTKMKNEFESNKEKDLKELNSLLQNLKNTLLDKKKSLNKNIYKDLDKRMDRTKENISKYRSQLESIDNNIKIQVDSLMTKKELKKSELQNTCEQSKFQINENSRFKIEEIKTKLNNDTIGLKDEIQKINDKIKDNSYKRESIRSKAAEMIKIKEEYKTNIIDKEISTCPTCDQEITGYIKTKLQNHINHIDEELSNMENEIIKISDDNKALIEKEKELNNNINDKIVLSVEEQNKILNKQSLEIKKIDKRLEEVLITLNTMSEEAAKEISRKEKEKGMDIERELAELVKHIDIINGVIEEKNELLKEKLEIENQISNKEREIKLKNEEKFDDTTLKSYVIKGKTLSNSVKETRKLKEFLEDELEVVRFWKTGFSPSGIQSMLIDESIPFMNRKVSEYLDKVSNGRYTATFDTQKENKSGDVKDKISVKVFDHISKANSRVKLSGGQERVIDIATILTLGDLQSNVHGMDFNILLFDEIFDSLDDSNIEYVSKLLKELTKEKTVIVISHRHVDQIDADEYLSFS